MKMGKILSAIIAGALATSLLTACGSDNNSSSEGGILNNTYSINNETTKLVGRSWEGDDDSRWFAMSGSGASFEYTGKKLEITFIGDTAATAGNIDNGCRIGIYIDGERVIDELIDDTEKTYTPFESTEEKTVTVDIVKLSEGAQSTCGIKPIKVADGEKITRVSEKAHKIEFIGDSITCGYGVDDEVKENHFKTATEDCTKAYAYKTAQLLDADYSLFSLSGYGIISGYSGNGQKVEAQQLPQYYNYVGYSWQSTEPSSVEWDFSWQPDVVVINLGTNDASYTKGDKDKIQDYIDSYVAFLKTVREKNPNAKIICSLGIMGQDLCAAIETVVSDYTTETGDTNITSYKFDVQNGNENGYAADWHPTAATHDIAAAALSEEIKTLMGW